MIIAIDGPAGTGKSTIAKLVAERLHFAYFDTGALYRAMTWYLLDKNIEIHNEKAIEKALQDFHVVIQTNDHNDKKYLVNDQDVTEQIRLPQISNVVSVIAAYKSVREKLVPIQRTFAENKNVVFEGRDMGSVVFPKAELKIFLTASIEVRAIRRLKQLQTKEPEIAKNIRLEELTEQIRQRDTSDSTRKISPLCCAKDAVIINTSELSVDQVVEAVINMIPKKEVPFYGKVRLIYFFVIFVVRMFFKAFYRHRVFGQEHFFTGKAIIAANHLSYLDPPAVAISCPQEIHFLAKKSLFKIFGLGWLIRKINSHPISRSTSDVSTFKEIIRLLQMDQKVLLFPEGTRSRTGERGAIMPGLGFLAYMAKADILPVLIYGTDAIWPPGKKFPKLHGRSICVFGSPIRFQTFAHLEKKEAIDAISKQIQQAIDNLFSWVENGCEGTPP